MAELRDPATGKIKPVYIIAAVGIGVVGLFALMGKGGSTGVTSGGQSSDNTDALAGLQDALAGLAGSGGGSGSNTSGTTGGGGGGGDSGGGGSVSAAPSGAVSSTPNQQEYTAIQIPQGDSNVAPSVGRSVQSPYQGGIGDAVQSVNTYPSASYTPQAISKPSNSGLSSAPTYSPTSVQIAVGKGPTATDSGPSGVYNQPPIPKGFTPVYTTGHAVGKGATQYDVGPSGTSLNKARSDFAKSNAVKFGFTSAIPAKKKDATTIQQKQQAVGKGAQR